MAVVIIDMLMAGQSAVTYRWPPVNQFRQRMNHAPLPPICIADGLLLCCIRLTKKLANTLQS
jgi:hypothetical protein